MGPEFDDASIEDAEIVRHEPTALIATDRGAAALAASERAHIQARVYLALQNPRNLAVVRDKIKTLLQRPSLAEKAVYRRPQGKKKNEATGQWEENFVEGASIRLAESLRKAYGNLDTRDRIIADDETSRTVMVMALDYESNTSESREIIVQKRIERRGFKKGGVDVPPDREIVSSRKNSYGDTVYLCVATDAEVMEMQNSYASRARRNAIIALIEADIVEDAVRFAKQVRFNNIAQQRVKAIEDLRAVYTKMGVAQAELADYLGRPIDNATADDLQGLEMLATAIREGTTSWKATLKARKEARAIEEADDAPEKVDGPPPGPPTKGADATRDAVARATKERTP